MCVYVVCKQYLTCTQAIVKENDDEDFDESESEEDDLYLKRVKVGLLLLSMMIFYQNNLIRFP